MQKKKNKNRLYSQGVMKNWLRNPSLILPPIKTQAASLIPSSAEPLNTCLLHFLFHVSSKSIIQYFWNFCQIHVHASSAPFQASPLLHWSNLPPLLGCEPCNRLQKRQAVESWETPVSASRHDRQDRIHPHLQQQQGRKGLSARASLTPATCHYLDEVASPGWPATSMGAKGTPSLARASGQGMKLTTGVGFTGLLEYCRHCG